MTAHRTMSPPVGGDKAVDYGRLVAEHTRDAIVVTGIDGRAVWVNPAFERLTEYELAEVVGHKPGDILQGAETDAATVRLVSRRLAERAPVKVELINYTRSGRPYWIEMDITPVFDAEGRHTAFVAVERDITERKAIEAEMAATRAGDARRREERRVLAEMSEWLYATETLDELCKVVTQALPRLVTNAEGILYVYRHSRDRLEPMATFGGMTASGALVPSDCWALRRGRSHTFGGQVLNIACNHRVPADTASVCVPLLAHGEAVGVLCVAFKDVAADMELVDDDLTEFEERRQAVLTSAKQIGLSIANVRLRTALKTQSTRDVLTGLPNRRAFLEAAREALAEADVTRQPLALLCVDVDHFKAVNDTYGHGSGDAALKALATIATHAVGTSGMVARFGGEEFIVLLPGADAEEAVAVAEALRQRVEAETSEGTLGCPALTVSVGVAAAEPGVQSLDALVERADRALYEAKRGGRNRVHLATPQDRAAGPDDEAPEDA